MIDLLGPTILQANFVPKGWGFEKWIDNNEQFCGKLLYFVKGRKCSAHFHRIKDETFYLHSGKMEIYYHDDVSKLESCLKDGWSLRSVLEKVVLDQGGIFKVPPGRVHQMIALEDSQLFEFSTHHEDDDSYRILKGD